MRSGWVFLLVGIGMLTCEARGDDIGDLIEQLRDPDMKIRKQAAEALAKSGKEAVPGLRTVLKDKTDTEKAKEIRMLAMEALAAIGPDASSTIPDLLLILRNRTKERQAAAVALGKIGKASNEGLAGFLKDKDPELRRFAILGLGHVGTDAKNHVPEITTHLNYPTESVRAAAAEALGRIGTKTKGILTRLNTIATRDKDLTCRIQATLALARLDPEDAATVKAVDSLFKDETIRAVQTVGNLGKEGTALLVVGMKSKDEDARYAALQALAWMRDVDEEIVPLVRKCMTEKSVGMRKSALGVLGRVAYATKGETGVPELVSALKDKNEEIRKLALNSVTQLGGSARSGVPQLAALLKDLDAPSRAQIFRYVFYRSIPDAVPALIPLLDDEELADEVRKCLEGMGRQSVPALASALKHDKPAIRQHAGELLDKMGPRAADDVAPALIPLLKDKNESVREAASKSLVKLGRFATPHLIKALADDDKLVRRYAAEALGEIGPNAKPAVKALDDAAKDDKDDDVRAAAKKALEQIQK